jgi:hypothetical protein
MSHQAGQFLISIYELCLAAELAHLRVEICSESGERNMGVPSVLGQPEFDWPGNRSSTMIAIGHKLIILDRIASCMILSPEA